MNPAIVAAIAYGILTLIGGVAGYLKAKSKPSLISGLISGVLLIAAALMQLQGFPFGSLLARIITVALIAVFAFRFQKTRKFMPAGLMIVAGAIALTIMLLS
jgi:uncharacterized membrane protein (UPF0136 family)